MMKSENLRKRRNLEDDAIHVASILSASNPERMEDGYRALMQKYWRLVAVLLASRIGDRREAEDLTQEAFLRAFRSLRKLKQPRAFLGWLLRIARNLGTDHLRTRRSTVSLDVVGEVTTARALASGHGEQAHYVDQLEADEELQHVLEAVDNLPEKYREVVALKYVQDLDGKAMADLLGEPEGTIRNRLFRALAKLRETLHTESESKS